MMLYLFGISAGILLSGLVVDIPLWWTMIGMLLPTWHLAGVITRLVLPDEKP
ncbi:hypothetical protein SEA_BIPAUNETO_22 [Gordonia phage BiPauneto]|nr:hypothetical protein SEA_BIPAUNETO_22 [Gordonia phage BiPauneto]